MEEQSFELVEMDPTKPFIEMGGSSGNNDQGTPELLGEQQTSSADIDSPVDK